MKGNVTLCHRRKGNEPCIAETGFVIPRENLQATATPMCFKVVPGGCHRYFFGVKVKTVKLIGGTRLRLLYMPAQIIQMMAFTQIMAIWTPSITP